MAERHWHGRQPYSYHAGDEPRVMDQKRSAIHLTIEHALGAVDAAAEHREPFHHLRLADFFPPDIYSAMLERMPAREDYRRMSGRAKYTRTSDGSGTRTKIDLFPEYIRHLPQEKKPVWSAVGRALCSQKLREAFKARLAPSLEKRFGPAFGKVGMYPVPVLTRDVPGYYLGIHADARAKGITVQLYLPRDRSIDYVGTVFHESIGANAYRRAYQIPFFPNTGYAFAVGDDTHHSVDTVGPQVRTRDSILLTYFVDYTALQIVRNRAKRLGNFVLNEFRSVGR
jgi:hypothetical protein